MPRRSCGASTNQDRVDRAGRDRCLHFGRDLGSFARRRRERQFDRDREQRHSSGSLSGCQIDEALDLEPGQSAVVSVLLLRGRLTVAETARPRRRRPREAGAFNHSPSECAYVLHVNGDRARSRGEAKTSTADNGSARSSVRTAIGSERPRHDDQGRRCQPVNRRPRTTGLGGPGAVDPDVQACSARKRTGLGDAGALSQDVSRGAGRSLRPLPSIDHAWFLQFCDRMKERGLRSS
jgi:hypothetical protein